MLVVPHDLKTFIHIFMSSETLFFPLQISECWLYHMTYRHFHLFICNETFCFLHFSEGWLYHMTLRHLFIYLWAVKPIFPCKFLNVGCTTWLTDICNLFISNETFFLAIFWMLVVPHDLQTCIHIVMSSETLIFLQFSECWLYHMTCRHLFI